MWERLPSAICDCKYNYAVSYFITTLFLILDLSVKIVIDLSTVKLNKIHALGFFPGFGIEIEIAIV